MNGNNCSESGFFVMAEDDLFVMVKLRTIKYCQRASIIRERKRRGIVFMKIG